MPSLPEALSPQLATLVERPPQQGEWLYEVKFDGYRVLARIDGGVVRLHTRTGLDWTHKLPTIAAELQSLKGTSAWLDGEIVVLGADGASDFGALQNAFKNGRADDIRYFVFDAPFIDGEDLRALGCADRRGRLQALMARTPMPHVQFSAAFESPGEELLTHACRLHLEGVIGKRRDAPYVGRRSPDWIKLKCTLRQEFVIVGYTEPQRSRVGLGALLLALHGHDGKLRYAGRVGTGFDDETLADLRTRLEPLAVAKTPVDEPPKEARQGQAVRPTLVAEVSFAQWTADGRVRHAVFHGLRSDKPAKAVTQEVAVAPPESPAPASPAAKRVASKAAPAKKKGSEPLPAAPRITHPERVVDASTGLTKLDVVNHYLRVARLMLPHLAQRPVAVLRAPAGLGRKMFFQKHDESQSIPSMPRLDPALDPEHPPLLGVDGFEALVGAAQMNVIEFHTWNARVRQIEKPDRMTFDLDPGEGLPWPVVQQAARLARDLLAELGLQSFLKTSGGKGLHVVVPLTPRDGWDAVKDFSKAVVERMAQRLPERIAVKSGPRNRVGKVFVDYLRNGRGATTVAAYSVRARPGLGVSIPCRWDELERLRGGDHWTVANAAERLDLDDDPWAGYAEVRQTLAAAAKALARAATQSQAHGGAGAVSL